MIPLLLGLLACAPAPVPTPAGRLPATGDAAPTPGPAGAGAEAAEAPPDGPLRQNLGANLYALDLPMRTQRGEPGRLDVERGHPVLLSMFYTTCPRACPLLIQDIQSLEATLPEAERARLRVVLVSLDPERDDRAALADVVTRHTLDERWTLGAVPPDAVREVAAALGVRYRPLPGGGFAHTAVLTLVDAQGVIVARSEGSDGREGLVAKIHELAGGPGT